MPILPLVEGEKKSQFAGLRPEMLSSKLVLSEVEWILNKGMILQNKANLTDAIMNTNLFWERCYDDLFGFKG